MSKVNQLKNKARREEQRENWSRAIELYTEALEASRKDGDAFADVSLYNRIGDIYLRIGQKNTAVRYYEQAIEHYAEQDLHTSAIALCNKVLRVLPNRCTIFLQLGRLHLETNLIADARGNYHRYATAMRERGALDDGLAALEELIERTGDPASVNQWVEWLGEKADTDEAVARVDKLGDALERHGVSAPEISERVRTGRGAELDTSAAPASEADPLAGAFLTPSISVPDAEDASVPSDARTEPAPPARSEPARSGSEPVPSTAQRRESREESPREARSEPGRGEDEPWREPDAAPGPDADPAIDVGGPGESGSIPWSQEAEEIIAEFDRAIQGLADEGPAAEESDPSVPFDRQARELPASDELEALEGSETLAGEGYSAARSAAGPDWAGVEDDETHAPEAPSGPRDEGRSALEEVERAGLEEGGIGFEADAWGPDTEPEEHEARGPVPPPAIMGHVGESAEGSPSDLADLERGPAESGSRAPGGEAPETGADGAAARPADVPSEPPEDEDEAEPVVPFPSAELSSFGAEPSLVADEARDPDEEEEPPELEPHAPPDAADEPLPGSLVAEDGDREGDGEEDVPSPRLSRERIELEAEAADGDEGSESALEVPDADRIEIETADDAPAADLAEVLAELTADRSEPPAESEPVAGGREPAAPEWKPVSEEPESLVGEPEPVASEPEDPVPEAEPAVTSESAGAPPEPAAAPPEPVAAPPEPVTAEPGPPVKGSGFPAAGPASLPGTARGGSDGPRPTDLDEPGDDPFREWVLSATTSILRRALPELESREEHDKALLVLARLAKLEPRDYAVGLRHVDYLERLGRSEPAREACLELAERMEAGGQIDEAREAFRRTLRSEPQNARARAGIARLEEEAGRAPPSGSAAAAARRADPAPATGPDPARTPDMSTMNHLSSQPATAGNGGGPRPYSGVAGGAEARMDFEQLLSEFRAELHENPVRSGSRSRTELGASLKEMGRLDDAIRELQAAIREPGAPPLAYELLAEAFLEKGQPRIAVRFLEKALTTLTHGEREILGVLYQLGTAYETLDDPSKALICYERIFSVDIDYRDIQERIMTCSV